MLKEIDIRNQIYDTQTDLCRMIERVPTNTDDFDSTDIIITRAKLQALYGTLDESPPSNVLHPTY